MCRNRPGPRCSDHSHTALEKATEKLATNTSQQASLHERLETLPAESKRAAQIQRNLDAAVEDEDLLIEKYEQAQLEYDATPRGQAELETKQADPQLTAEERDDVQERLHLAKIRREWQRRVAKQLQVIQRERGMDAAALWAYQEMQQASDRFDELSAELLEQDPDLVAPSHVPARARRSAKQTIGVKGNPRRVKAKTSLLKRGLRGLMRQRFLYSLIIGDLDQYLVSKFGPDRLFRLGVSQLRRRFI